MTKEDVSKSLALSCVEAYFLAWFKTFFDVRQLYVESFVPFNRILSDFLGRGIRYEREYIPRVQDVSERLGLTRHIRSDSLTAEQDVLTLVRVNEKFVQGAKRVPWREDHFIALYPSEEGFRFVSSYPLSSGHIGAAELREVASGESLRFYGCRTQEQNHDENYAALSRVAFGRICEDFGSLSGLEEIDPLRLRDAALFLRTTRRRLRDWLAYEATRGAVAFDETLKGACERLIGSYDRLLVQTEYRLARGSGASGLGETLGALAGRERELAREIMTRRRKNGDD